MCMAAQPGPNADGRMSGILPSKTAAVAAAQPAVVPAVIAPVVNAGSATGGAMGGAAPAGTVQNSPRRNNWYDGFNTDLTGGGMGSVGNDNSPSGALKKLMGA